MVALRFSPKSPGTMRSGDRGHGIHQSSWKTITLKREFWLQKQITEQLDLEVPTEKASRNQIYL